MSETPATEVADIKALVTDLARRVDELEAELRQIRNLDEVPEEVILAIAAACAAYLGKRATVRQVRLRHNVSWGAQGRASIHQSHRINRRAR